jgi:hypothetical protein
MGRKAFNAKVLALTLVLSAACLVITESPAAATDGCPNGSFAHCYGTGWLYNNNNLHAVGANLEVDCLAVVDRGTDFANMEMWLRTENTRPFADQNWVEEGMTSGRLWYSPGLEIGFIWYWADSYTDQDNYYEHYIGAASVGTYTNVTFTWEGNSTWGVYRGGTRVGGSGVGAYPGYANVGGESTTDQTAIWGHAVDWQYKNVAGTWNWISPSIVTTGPAIKASASSGTGRAHAQVNVTTPTWKCGGNPPAEYLVPQGSAGVGLTDPETLLRSTLGTKSLLRSQITRVAASLGVQKVGTLKYIASTRNAAMSRASKTTIFKSQDASQMTAGSTLVDNRPVYVVQVHGSFVKEFGQGRNPVRGNVLEVVVDAKTGQMTDWGILGDSNDFASLGVPKTA